MDNYRKHYQTCIQQYLFILIQNLTIYNLPRAKVSQSMTHYHSGTQNEMNINLTVSLFLFELLG